MKIETLTPQICGLLLGQTANLYWKNESGQLEFERAGILISIKPKTEGQHPLVFQCGNGLSQRELAYDYREVVFRLRRLESLTESEARELYEISRGEKWDYEYNSYAANRDRGMGKIWSCLENWWMGNYEMFAENGDWLIGDPNVWLNLLSKGFDLLGLIDAGLAKEVTN